MKKVSIITVNYNQPKLTELLLASLRQVNTYDNIEIIVVDNASKLNPVPNWELAYPNMIFIRSDENLGFAGGNNIGIAAATGEFLFLINNDTEVTPNLVEQLVNTLEDNPNVGLISPLILYYEQPEIIQYAGFTPMNFFTGRNKAIGQFEVDKGQRNYIGPTGYIHGAAMMLRKEHATLVGLMPDHYFLYYEEGDWCEMFKRKNLEIWINGQAKIYHKESMSVGKNSKLKAYFMNRNRILFIRRNAWFYQAWFFLFYYILIVTPKQIVEYIKNGETKFIPMLLKAIWWNMTNSRTSSYLYIPS